MPPDEIEEDIFMTEEEMLDDDPLDEFVFGDLEDYF